MSDETHNTLVRTALVYDFDGTLAPGSIQEHSLLPNFLGVTKEEFWKHVKNETKDNDADEILMYMWHILDTAKKLGKTVTREILQLHGKSTPFFAGVDDWFARLNEFAKDCGLQLEHYIISSGNYEMIAASKIAQHFTGIFASRFHYDAKGNAQWPAVAINFTTKTQYLFRINKEVLNHWDNETVNRWVPMAERPIPFQRLIYLGDGDTDIPSMKMVHHQGGHSIAVFDPNLWSQESHRRKVYNLISEDRAHFVVPADYSDGSQLDVTAKGILGRIAREHAGFREKSNG